MSLQSSTQTIRERVGEDCGLGATLKFHFADQGVIHIDASVVPNVVSNDDAAAQCTISMALPDFESMLAGELPPIQAFTSGKLRVDGDMGIAMKLQSVL